MRVGREPVGDYLAFAQGLEADRNRAVMDDVLGRLDYIGNIWSTDYDRDSFRTWLRGLPDAHAKDRGLGSQSPARATNEKMLRSRLFNALGYDARDPEVMADARKIADKALDDPSSVDRQIADGALALRL